MKSTVAFVASTYIDTAGETSPLRLVIAHMERKKSMVATAQHEIPVDIAQAEIEETTQRIDAASVQRKREALSAPGLTPTGKAKRVAEMARTTRRGKAQVSSSDDSKGSQNVLIRALWQSMNKRNHTVHGLASVLNVTYGYLLALARGERPMNMVSHDILVRAAQYLQIPVAQAYVWAGVLQPSDFYNARSLRYELDNLYEDLMSNTGVNMFAPSREVWESLPDSAKLTIGLLYEQVREKQFITQIDTVTDN